jgi:hypothetical protein
MFRERSDAPRHVIETTTRSLYSPLIGTLQA